MLSAYRVLDLTDERGHFAGFILAMLGAEVIAVEPPGGSRARWMGPWLGGEAGSERSLTHLVYNRAKQSIVLDYAQPGPDREALFGLVAGADVLIESDEPGRMAAIGLGPDALPARHPSTGTPTARRCGSLFRGCLGCVGGFQACHWGCGRVQRASLRTKSPSNTWVGMSMRSRIRVMRWPGGVDPWWGLGAPRR